MRQRICNLISTSILYLIFVSVSQAQSAFNVVPLGVKGGGAEGNLSAYMIAPINSKDYVCLDAGTVRQGVEVAVANGVFAATADQVSRSFIKGFLISHAHLDHVSGMITNAPEDTAKSIYALPKCLDVIKNHYFNWESWPNFGSEGVTPLKKYTYKPLSEGQEMTLENTEMTVKAFSLSHGSPYESAAFLIQNNGKHALYFGDTGPDEVEKSTRLQKVWEAVAPLIRAKTLTGIFLEVSYPNEQPDNKLFGHLTPNWIMKEMDKLAMLAGKENMKDLKLIITHIKPTGQNEVIIKGQLGSNNALGLEIIYPEQGTAFEL
ncbi:MBL fold metallo-hydrolase [Dyadobacter frigoris]|uniref:3',5'-cyclic-nucleotide phosphodiesterase n=1 Tax=Dyadobacter frigoris TaxID=2576211 RepID=A0A4U6D9R7_9BACT|nr:3',5'-cyclic-nucleotide phosphodiesterase [Dyadobacter frigoris]TKT94272.1 3',5'-cyclic-nucleotide phosphodiesterase [Dyadobacter frigoris]GLU56606.1 3',5'-cyclic-nucleotide phosphodiesterase [Dyadobacter frigoris]